MSLICRGILKTGGGYPEDPEDGYESDRQGGNLGGLSVSSCYSHSVRAIHYFPLPPQGGKRPATQSFFHAAGLWTLAPVS